MVTLVTRAEAIEATTADGRWAMTAFSRYRLCELLEIPPYSRYEGDLDGDPAVLKEEAAELMDRIGVSIEDLSWGSPLVMRCERLRRTSGWFVMRATRDESAARLAVTLNPAPTSIASPKMCVQPVTVLRAVSSVRPSES